MPNYGLVINSKFRPFSYQEMLAPVQQSTEAHQALEDTLSDLSTKANIWEHMIDKELDPDLYAQYKDFANTLDAQASTLSSEGLNPTSRQAILNLRKRYSKDITPIEQAFTKKGKHSEMQLQASINDPSIEFSRIASITPLSDYVKNPDLKFDIISKNQVTQKVFQQASTLSKELIEGGTENLRKLLSGDYYEYVKQRGFTKEAVLAAIMNDPEASSILQKIVEDAVDETGVRDWKDEDNKGVLDRVYAAARQGLWGAVGTSEVQLVNNWRAQENLRHSHSLSEISARNSPKNDPYLIPFKDGEETIYFDPKVSMWRDKDGYAIPAPKNSPVKVGTKTTPEQEGIKIARYGDIEKAGFRIAGVAIKGKNGEGDWRLYQEGEDLQGGKTPSFFATPNWKPWFNRSDASYTPRSDKTGTLQMGIVQDFSIIPDEVAQQMANQLQANGILPDEDGNYDESRFMILRASHHSGKPGEDYILAIK